MRTILLPREFFYLKNNCEIWSRPSRLIDYINTNQERFRFKLNDLEYLERKFTKVGLLLLLFRCSLLYKRSSPKEHYLKILSVYIIKARIDSSRELNIFRSICMDNKSIWGQEKINLVAPVCPDYAYKTLSPSLYRYTFDGIGEGIGLVARKAITSIKTLLSSIEDCPYISTSVKPIILVGDFEAKTKNLNALNMDFNKFCSKIEGSVKAIADETGWETNKFTMTCGGFRQWMTYEEILKHQLSLNCYDDLIIKYKTIPHEKNLISRIPLYSKWFKGDCNYKDIFFDQVIEYILMGRLISEYYKDKTILLTSDHRAMRHYYGLGANIDMISTSASY